MAIIIDGKTVSASVKSKVADECRLLFERTGKKPGLAVIIVGDDPASHVYVNNKKKACELVGFVSREYALPASTSQEELSALVKELNNDKEINMEMLDYYNIEIAGKECVVVGRSNIVGKPMAMLLLHRNGTVTVCHSKTKNLKEVCKRADILVAAVGIPKFVSGDMIKEGAVVIDVGINRTADGKLCGDVDFAEAEKLASYITPVPGGVGPMTIAVLMKNTLTAFKLQNKLS